MYGSDNNLDSDLITIIVRTTVILSMDFNALVSDVTDPQGAILKC